MRLLGGAICDRPTLPFINEIDKFLTRLQDILWAESWGDIDKSKVGQLALHTNRRRSRDSPITPNT